MKRYIFSLILLLFIFVISSNAFAVTEICVRPAADCTGDDSGSDWNNAKPMPLGNVDGPWQTFWKRGDTGAVYYIADGTYIGGRVLFNEPADGTKIITFKKATVDDHHTDTGWSSALGDGQAIFRSAGDATIWWIKSDYWDIDGQVGSGGNPDDYGFYVTRTYEDCVGLTRSDLITVGSWGIGNPSHINFKHIASTNCDCPNNTVGQDFDIPQDNFYGAPQSTRITDVNISYCFMEKAQNNLMMRRWDDSTIEYSFFYDNWSTAAMHGQQVSPGIAKNIIIKYNIFKDSIASAILFHAETLDPNENWQVYGNIVYQSGVGDGFDAGLATGAFGTGNTGKNYIVQNVGIYNNTLVNLTGTTGIFYGSPSDGGIGNTAYNNLWYNCQNPNIIGGTGIYATAHDYNAFFNCTGNIPSSANIQIGSIDPFVDSANYNFHLATATQNGKSDLGSPYNIDFDGGDLRGTDGVWDLGAFEYSGAVQLPNPPTGLTIVTPQ